MSVVVAHLDSDLSSCTGLYFYGCVYSKTGDRITLYKRVATIGDDSAACSSHCHPELMLEQRKSNITNSDPYVIIQPAELLCNSTPIVQRLDSVRYPLNRDLWLAMAETMM